ncbi:MAG: NADH:flavin oxidoreductase [Candidatus Bipolaricaulota bacterium]
MSMLFTQARIGSLEIPNRIVRSATAERLADDTGVPLPELATLLAELARGGAGLIIIGHMYVSTCGRAHPGMTGIADDSAIGVLGLVVDAVHDEGGLIAAQLNHAGMKAAPDVASPYAPSDVHPPLAARPATRLSDPQIHTIIASFACAAERAVAAGFDAIQIHSAHGYLGSQFLSPATNRRADVWGGSPSSRMRFLQETCREVRDVVGPDYPLLVKLGMVDQLDGGLQLDVSLSLVERLADFGIDALEISGGISQGRSLNIRPVCEEAEEAYFREFARQARERTDLPILVVGGLRSRPIMEDVLKAGDADFISLCRPLVCEPDLPRRFENRLQLRSSCVSGNRCWPEKATDMGISCKCLSRPPKEVS